MTTFENYFQFKEHKTSALILTALGIGIIFTTQHALSNPPVNKETLHKQLSSHSPYSEQGELIYKNLIQSDDYSAILSDLQLAANSPQATPLMHTHLGSLLSLLAWDEKDTVKQINMATQADAAFDKALQKSPYYWDAWMGKAEIYAYSEDTELKKHAITILTYLSSNSPTNPAPPLKKQKSAALLNKLNTNTL